MRRVAWLTAVIPVVFAPPGIAGPTLDFSPPPGALNPQVTQADIAQTICVRG